MVVVPDPPVPSTLSRAAQVPTPTPPRSGMQVGSGLLESDYGTVGPGAKLPVRPDSGAEVLQPSLKKSYPGTVVVNIKVWPGTGLALQLVRPLDDQGRDIHVRSS